LNPMSLLFPGENRKDVSFDPFSLQY